MKVLFVTTVSHTPNQRNLNHWQRVYFLSRSAELSILAVKGADFGASAHPDTAVIQGAVSGKLGLLLKGMILALQGRARRFDIVITEPSLIGIVGFWFRLAGCRRWVVDIWDIPGRYHQRGIKGDNIRRALARMLLKSIYRFADRFVISIRPDFELRRFEIPSDKMLLCRNAIWLDGIPSGHSETGERPLVLCMRSEHTQEMGLDVLADAVPRLEQGFPDLHWLIIGRIPAHVADQITSIRTRDNVEFIEFLDHDVLLKRIRSASICVIPFHDIDDLRQTYPVKVLEYMALGKAVVASDLAGMRDLINHGGNGLLFRPGDATDLADKISEALTDESLRKRLSDGALATARDYDCALKNRRIIADLEGLL